jgi:hypothetical protein|tara:strand:+ start:1870 stop:2352 length:483 start_codon:yes stop_codon:yes gene_type:complete
MKIIIWTNRKGIINRLIRFFTHGKGTHAGFLRSDNKTIHEAFWPKVRDRQITAKDYKEAEVFEISGLTKQQHKEFEILFNINIKKRIHYSIADLFRYLFNMPNKRHYHTFCSRYIIGCCQTVLKDNQVPLVRLPSKDWASPRDLLISPLLKQSSWTPNNK